MCADIDKKALTLTHVYFCPQLLDGAKRRKKENVVRCPVLWADLDSCNPQVLQVPASIVVQSSTGRWQAFWRMEESLSPDAAQTLCMKIAYFHADQGADRSGWDLTQLMRVPYTPNYKYGDLHTAPIVTVLTTTSALYRPSDFVAYPAYDALKFVDNPVPLPEDLPQENPEDIMQRYRMVLHPSAYSLFVEEPTEQDDWSKLQWKLAKLCSEAGMSPEETFSVVRSAACNKYARDGRPQKDLWAEIKKVYVKEFESHNLIPTPTAVIPELISEEEVKQVQARVTFVEKYIKWASDLTDAAPQYHQAGAFVILSAILCGAIKLDTSFGMVIPNLWFMIVADTTLTRKAQPLDAKILTINGWKLMGDIKIGEQVIGSDGKPTTVLGIYPQGVKQNYKVTFNDGAKTECSSDHLWTHKRPGKKSKWSTWTLKKLMSTPLQDHNGTWVRQIPMVEPVQLPTQDLILDPYLLGLLLGNGTFYDDGSIRFSGIDEEVLFTIREKIKEHELYLDKVSNDGVDYRITTRMSRWSKENYVSNAIKVLGLRGTHSHEKFIPKNYWLGSADQRLALLRGLMDTDGWVGENRSTNFASSSKKLALQVQYLVRSLGGWSKYDGGHEAGYNDIDGNFIKCKDSHLVSVSMPMGINPFSLSRKAIRLNNRSWARPRVIKKIEHVGQKPMQCIKVDNEDGLYITDDFILTHNTTAMNIAMSLLDEVNPDAIMGTDGSPEGILSAMKDRPKKPSIYLRDEFTGLIEQMAHKDYMAGLGEQLTKLYDGQNLKRLLRKEEISIRDPRLIIFAGGVKTKMQMLLSEEHVNSGFIPRFVFITAVADRDRVRPVGPPVKVTHEERNLIKDELINIDMQYNSPRMVLMPDGKSTASLRPEFDATLTPEAWERYNQLENTLTNAALDTGLPHLTPVYDRLAKSTLKAAILIAASQQLDGGSVTVEERDIVHAIYYCRHWHVYASEMVNGIGKSSDERMIDAIVDFSIQAGPMGVGRSDIMRKFRLDSRRAELLLTTINQRRLLFLSSFGGQPRYVGK
jgi:hypothetical protein